MTADTPYQNREIDEKFTDIKETLIRIEKQTTKTNGRVTKLERYAYVVATAVAVLLANNGSSLIGFIKSIL